MSGPCLVNEGSTYFEDVRVRELGLSNLFADVLLMEAERVSGETLDGAMFNGGALRGGVVNPDFTFVDENARIGKKYGPGPITEDDIRGWYPWKDQGAQLVVMTLTGAQIRRTLEAAVRNFADDAKLNFGPDLVGDKGGWFAHVSKIKYEVTCPGTTRLQIGPADCDPFVGTCVEQNTGAANSISRIEVNGQLILDKGEWVGGGDTKTFRIAVPAFMGSGLDNHLALKEGTNRVEFDHTQVDLAEATVSYFKANSPVTLKDNDGRITITGTVDGLACNLPFSCLPSHMDHPNCSHL